MKTLAKAKPESVAKNTDTLALHSYVAGEKVYSDHLLEVTNPYNGSLVGTVTEVGNKEVKKAIEVGIKGGTVLTRYERSQILEKAKHLLQERKEEFARLICAESGLCMNETLYEVGRATDVLTFAAIEALHDDGEIYSCDISPQGKARKIYTISEPLELAVAITPFNHPLNQVVHKVAPAIAAGTPLILKPSEKTPLTAIRFAELLYEAGLPPYMLSVLLGPTEEVAIPLVKDDQVQLVSFTGSVAVGKAISRTAGYKKLVLELGGNAALIVLEDADMDLAIKLATEGAFRNSGQRCTAVKRILAQESILDEFTERFVEAAKEYTYGDPADSSTRVGTVIDEPAAEYLEEVVQKAVKQGAKVMLGGERKGALLAPTVITDVPRDAQMITCESFGPLAPIMKVKDLDDAIALTNSTAYGLASGVVTRNLEHAIKAVKSLKVGTVNINEVPGYRIEKSPFGGIKDSGLGVKEGVIEAIKCFSYVKTYSLPW